MVITGKQVTAVLSAIVLVIAVAGGIIGFDEKYISVSELTIAEKTNAEQAKRLFILFYEDQLDDINFKMAEGTASNFEKAKKQRIIRRIEFIQQL